MSLCKRGGTWYVDVAAPTGERVRRATGTANKAQAQEFHDRLKSELWRLAKMGDRPRRTWNEAVVRWLKESNHKSTIDQDKAHLRWLDRYLDGKHLDVISRSTVDQITDAKLAEGVSNATVNRILEVLRAILRKCVNDWEWLDRAPKIRMLKEPTRRIRFLSQDEAQRLLAALPAHLADMAAFTLATGLRRVRSGRCCEQRHEIRFGDVQEFGRLFVLPEGVARSQCHQQRGSDDRATRKALSARHWFFRVHVSCAQARERSTA